VFNLPGLYGGGSQEGQVVTVEGYMEPCRVCLPHQFVGHAAPPMVVMRTGQIFVQRAPILFSYTDIGEFYQ
jgi:hypothetical protein